MTKTYWLVMTPKKLQTPRNCIICQVSFIPERCIAKCCSKRCRIKYANSKRHAAKRIWAKNNSEYYVQYNRLRRANMLKAKPKWVNEVALREIYKQAKEQGLTVDHIVPLTHEKVCGLHVPWNLQLLSREENTRKYNILVGYSDE